MVRGSLKSKMVGALIVFVSLSLLTYVVLNKRLQHPPIVKPVLPPAVVHQTISIPTPPHEPVKQWQPRQTVSPHETVVVHPIVAKPIQEKPVVVAPVHHAAIPKPTPVAHVYWLQIASYHALQNARLMRRRLLLLGYPSRIELAHVHGTAWYRLSAGPFASQQKALQAQRSIHRKWKLKTHVFSSKG